MAKFRVLQHNLSSRDVFSILILTYIRPHCILLRDKWEKSGGGEGKRLLAFAKRRKTVTRKPRFFFLRGGEKKGRTAQKKLSVCRLSLTQNAKHKIETTHAPLFISALVCTVSHGREKERKREREKALWRGRDGPLKKTTRRRKER